MLEGLGFGPVEEHLYGLLVTRGRMPLAELIADGDAKPHLQRQALDTLVAKGLVRRLAGPDHEFVVAPPEPAFDALIAERTHELHKARTVAAELADRVRRLTQDVDPTELIEIVSGEGSLRQLFLQMVRCAREELAVFDCPPYAVDVEESMNEQSDRLGGGVRFRTVFDRSLLEEPVHVSRILRGVAAGEEARVATVPLKLAVIDGDWGVLPLLHADGRTPDAAVIVRRSVLLDSLIALFESVWRSAVEIRPQAGTGLLTAGTPEAELRELAHLLAAGMTDTAIARHLGISERTVRRRIKDLMSELRVDSRFLAGVRVAERGWL